VCLKPNHELRRVNIAEEYKVGLFASLAVAAVGPAIVYAAYFVKLRLRGLRDTPQTVMIILTVVSLAMVAFAVS
jgi:hypothetical protein